MTHEIKQFVPAGYHNAWAIQLRRGTAAAWSALNPILPEGSPGFELDTGVLKIGDGTSKWTDLAGISGGAAVVTTAAGVIDLSAYITKLEAESYTDDAADQVRMEFQAADDDLQAEIDALKASGADNALDLQDQISTIVTGLKHNAPVDSLTNDPPPTPREDAYYIVGTVPTGAFVGHANAIATFDPKTKWTFEVPESGEARLVEDQNQIWAWSGTKWVQLGSVASKGDSDIHSYPEVVALAGGDEIPLTDVTDKWAKKKIQVINLREDIATYVSDKAMNLDNKGIDLAKNQLRGTIDNFNAALTDGYEFATKDDVVEGDAQALIDANSYTDSTADALKDELAQQIVDGDKATFDAVVQLIVDHVAQVVDATAPTADLSGVQAQFASQAAMTDAKFDSLAAAIDAKLATLPVGDVDLSEYETTQEISDQFDSMQDYMVNLLARHASADASLLAPIKQALDDVFAANTGTSVKDDAPSTKPGRNVKSKPTAPPPPPPKPWVERLPGDTDYEGDINNTFDPPYPQYSSFGKLVKGCVTLGYGYDAYNKMNARVFIFDGRVNYDNLGTMNGGLGCEVTADTSAGPNPNGEVKAFYNGPTALSDLLAHAWDAPNQMACAAAADGIHVRAIGTGTPSSDFLCPYPAGVTLADMPASKTF